MKKQKFLCIVFVLASVHFSLAQSNSGLDISLGYGLNNAIKDELTQSGFFINESALIYNAGLHYTIKDQVTLGLISAFHSSEVQSGRNGISLGQNANQFSFSINLSFQYTFYSWNNFNFKTGSLVGMHRSTISYQEEIINQGEEFLFSVNPLSISYSFDRFSIYGDAIFGQNLFANYVVGVKYLVF